MSFIVFQQELRVDDFKTQATTNVLIELFRNRSKHDPLALRTLLQNTLANRKLYQLIDCVIKDNFSEFRYAGQSDG